MKHTRINLVAPEAARAIIWVVLLLSVSCKKEEAPEIWPLVSSWRIRENTYTALKQSSANNSYVFTAKDNSVVSLIFKTKPTTTRTYTFTDSTNAEVQLAVSTMNPESYYYTTSGSVHVTVRGNAIRFQMNGVKLLDRTGSFPKAGNPPLDADLVY